MNSRDRVRRVTCLFFFLVLLAGCDQTIGTSAQVDVLPVVTVPGNPLPINLNLGLSIVIDSESIDNNAEPQIKIYW